MWLLKLLEWIKRNLLKNTSDLSKPSNLNQEKTTSSNLNYNQKSLENISENNEVIYMVTLNELLKGKNFSSLPIEHQGNLLELLKRINVIRDKYGKPMTPSSGYRSMEEHLGIYKKKGITDPKKIPMKSKHLYGQAVDIYDPNKALQAWCKANVKVLEEVGLWMEDFSATPNWCHFQIVPPASGKRFFLP